MGFIDRVLGRTPVAETTPIAEANANQLGDIERRGYEFGIPHGGTETESRAKAASATRRQVMEELYQAYLACPWVSTCADTVARKVTAGGLNLVPDEGDIDQPRPPQIQALDALMKLANDREDGIQLLRSTVTDLMVFGDGWIETGSLGDLIASMWTLDATTMSIGADEHGNLTNYFQDLDAGRQATFDPDEVIHISLDSPRGGMYGVSPTQKLMVTITTWLFAAACLKEYYRRGMPLQLAVDLGSDTEGPDRERWRSQFQARHLGPRNIGQPVITSTGIPGQPNIPPVKELGREQIADLHNTLNRCRDEMISGYGLSPAGVGVIESGNLGGGTGEAQAKTEHYGTVVPVQNILLEKLNFHLIARRGIVGWHFEFGEVDYRDSKVVEDIRDQRLRNGSYTLNVYRAEIGEDPVEGGDEPVLVDRQNLVLWRDMADFSKAYVASKDPAAKPAPVVVAPPAADGREPQSTTGDDPALGGDVSKESAPAYRARKLGEAWDRAFEAQRARANRELKDVDQ